MKSGSCENGDNCKFGHLGPAEAKRMGLEPPKGGKGGKGRKGKAAPAEASVQQGNGGTVTAHCAPKTTSAATAQALQDAHKAQDDAGAAYAASVRQE